MKAYLVLGTVATLLALVLAGQWLWPEWTGNPARGLPPLAPVAPDPAAAAVAATPAAKPPDLARIREQVDPGSLPADPAGLLRFLAEQQSRLTDGVAIPEALAIHIQRNLAADQLLKLQPSGPSRLPVIRHKLDALVNLAASGDSRSRQELATTVTRLESDPDPRIAGAAALAELLADTRLRLSHKDVRLDPLVARTRQIADQFADQPRVLGELVRLADDLLEQGFRDTWLSMIGAISAACADQRSPQIRDLAGRLDSRLRLAEYDFDGIVNRLRFGDAAAVEDFRQAVTRILSAPDLQPDDVPRLLRSVCWLETEQQIGLATEANRILNSAADDITHAPARDYIRSFCTRNQVRLGWRDQPLPSGLPLAGGGVLDPDQLPPERTVLVFWSAAEPRSVEILKQIAGQLEAAGDSRWNLVSVCFSRNVNITRTLFGGQPPAWPIVMSCDGRRDLASEFGIEQTPHVMLLDEDRRIVSTSVTPGPGSDWLDRLATLSRSDHR